MLIALVLGALISFVLSVPPGPIGVTVIRFGLLGKMKPGLQFASGAATMDVFFCLLAIFATSAAISAIGGFTEEHPFIMLGFQVVIIIGFVLFGIINLRSKDNEADFEKQEDEEKTFRFIKYLMTRGPFLLGVALALANVPNPTFLPSLAYVTMNVHSFNLIENTTLSNTAFALGFGLGNFIWFFLLLRIVMHFKSKMSALMITRVRQFTGLSLIGFGTFLGYRLVTITHWPELLRFVFAF